VAPGSEASETFKVMERRLLRAIINPAMALAWLFGGLMLATPGLIDWGEGWIWVKLATVTGLSGLHGFFSRWRRDFEADRNQHSARFYCLANELPTLALIVIVVMVIVRPF
jgi:putative membrane protein